MKTKNPCNPVRKPPVSRVCGLDLSIPMGKPDLQIYSQVEAMDSGIQVTWDSPDIDTYRGSTNNEIRILDTIRARIRNVSTIAPASNAIVHCDTGPFGIGTARTRLASQVVSVLPSQQIEVSFPVPPGFLNGEQRIATHITIELPSDLNPEDNSGSQVAYGGYSSVIGREPVCEFPVVNRTGITVNFKLLSLQNDLSAIIEPQSFSLAPLEQIQARILCKVPDNVHSTPPKVVRMEATVLCLKENGELYSGLTFFILVDN